MATESLGSRGGLHHQATAHCPRCGSDDTRRSKRRGAERLLSHVGLWPYRCGACGERFHRWSLHPAH
jgi:hypothetical protein